MRNKSKGFTLVELLVVISIIAMLLAVLIPALNKARQSAYSVVCRSHMRQCGLAMTTYFIEWNNFFAGPNTSGIALNSNSAPTESSASTPVQNMDWVSPTLGRELALPKNRYKRLTRILNTDLRCGANNLRYQYIYNPPSDWPKSLKAEDLRYASLSAVLGFHVYNSNVTLSNSNIITASDVKDKVELPRSYVPKMQMIGSPAQKIYIMDGARYIDTTLGASFNDFPKQVVGGNFMLYGPAVAVSGDPFANALKGVGTRRLFSPSLINYKYAWRHNKGLNAVFFDGHCISMKAQDSLNISYYFPKGTKVVNAELTQDLTDTTGMIIK